MTHEEIMDLTDTLAQFSGSETIYRHMNPRVLYTDGVRYMAQKAGAYWLLDVIASYMAPKLLAHEMSGFQIWELHRFNDGDRPKKKVRLLGGEWCQDPDAVVTMKFDSHMEPAVRQYFGYTDFPLYDLKLYAVANGNGFVIMLPTEY